jgi:hypothetical protein
VPGKTTFIPQTGHTDKSFSVEEWFADIGRSETFCGIKWAQASLQLPPTGMSTVAFTGTGKDYGQPPSNTRYFTSPTAQGTSSPFAAVNGLLRVNGAVSAAVTGFSMEIAAAFSGDPVLGQNSVPTQFAGRVKVSGQFTAYFEDGTLPAVFSDETEIGLQVALTTNNTAAADFLTVSLSRVKLGGADKNDGEGGVVRTYPFTALLNTAGGAHEVTTVAIQDSLA